MHTSIDVEVRITGIDFSAHGKCKTFDSDTGFFVLLLKMLSNMVFLHVGHIHIYMIYIQ